MTVKIEIWPGFIENSICYPSEKLLSKWRWVRMELDIEEGMTLLDLVKRLCENGILNATMRDENEHISPSILIVVNGEIISHSNFANRLLKDNDNVSIVPVFFDG
ncbi:MAG: MoaD/ThiS family protein [Candidatus Bathyarchaeia archaeon]